MVVHCNLQNCESNSKYHRNLSFFRVPTDLETRQKWADFAGWKKISNYFTLCENHFDRHDILKKYPRALLRKRAIPRIKRAIEISGILHCIIYFLSFA
ncbi:hypothetical protein ABEB36_000264 [Hypothenemus hampei]|uniref:THAP-type domain-containing protein n=1 Tax=Hypothenemus hampei TaxID=57062 RepID=A0ABD1FAP0_HYPHA